jgi:hypothetical protein
VLPIRSSVIAIEPVDTSLRDELMLTRRMYGDSRRIMAF